LTSGTISPIIAIMSSLGRPLEFDPDKAIEIAMEVFWCMGYENTSMTDLLGAMDLSKSSFYQTFGSKQQIFERCLKRYADMLSKNMEKELNAADSGRRFIENLFDTIANTAQQAEGAKGCLMVNSANEFGQRDPAIAISLNEGLLLFTEIFMKAVKRAQSEGEISVDADPHAIVDYLHVSVSGLRTMIKAGADIKSAKGTVALILKALD
jgi:TetR/AcrR family transcriptional regulator, transcriptional repressor for nem operon